MKQFKKIVPGALFLTALMAASNLQAADPCSQTTQLSGGTTINNQNKTGNTSTGYQYEIWRDGNGGSLTLYPKDACFKAEWNNAGDYLGRVGKTFNNPAWNNLGGDLVAEYAYKKSGNDGGTYSYIGVYGWMDSPQIEYYVVDDWLHDRGNPGGSYMGKNYGTITVDGDEYVVWSGQRTGASKWGNSTFTQIFSVRKTRRQCGTINVSEHFRQWSKLGLNLGKLMEAQILAEAGGGSGYVDFTYATVNIEKEGYTNNNTNNNNNNANNNNANNNNNTNNNNNNANNNSSTETNSEPTDPCSQKTKHSGGTNVTSNGVKDIGNGYNYEFWRDGSSGSMTVYGGDAECAFKANWQNSGDFLARVGYYDGSAKKKYTELGDIVAGYNYSKSGDGGGSYSYIGVYGWTKSPLIEYYIVDDSFTPNGGGMFWGASQKGTYTVNGVTYKLMVGQRNNAPSIEGTSNFQQIFAVRSSYQQCGTIPISEHFKNWEKLGVTLGGIYDCKILCEVGGGSGSIDYSYASMCWKGCKGAGSICGEAAPVEPKEPQGPYTSAIAIPGTVEVEEYDKGGNGFAYSDSDDENEGDAKFRTDEGVDVVKGGTGKAVGYTTDSEWLEFTVNVKEAGEYNIEAYASNGNGGIDIDLYVDDKKVASLSGSSTGDWDTYEKIKGKTSSLTAGEHILKVKFASSYTNLDYVKFYKDGDEPVDTTVVEPVEPVAASGNFFDENGAYYGPDCDKTNGTGAYYTGDYTSPFATVLGKSDEDIQKKLDQLWDHYFKGSNKVYYDKGSEAYILDTGNNDVRSEGMSYGMMICVQTNHKEEFDKLWSFAKNHMWHKSGQWDGYFAWQCGTDGSQKDQNCAPDGEMYFMTALLFAANRWNDSKYMDDAQYILSHMWKGGTGSLFNESQKVVTFQPYNCSDFSDPSYDLPAFVDLFSRWSSTNNSKWAEAATATRNHLYKSSNTKSGLFTDYNNFDGTPKSVSYNSNSHRYMYDAMRCAMNFGMDYYLFGVDNDREEEMARRIIDFFESNGYKNARFDWDGSNPSESYTLGETGANAVACYALMNNPKYTSQVKTNLNKAWNAGLATGQYRYYDGLVHYLAMLHLCGSFKIWKPAPDVKDKQVSGENEVEFNGVKYTDNAVVYSFDDCQLYKVAINVEHTGTNNAVADNQGVQLTPNPNDGSFTLVSSEEIVKVEIVNTVGQTVYRESGNNNLNTNLPAGIYFLKAYTASGESFIKKLQVR